MSKFSDNLVMVAVICGEVMMTQVFFQILSAIRLGYKQLPFILVNKKNLSSH